MAYKKLHIRNKQKKEKITDYHLLCFSLSDVTDIHLMIFLCTCCSYHRSYNSSRHWHLREYFKKNLQIIGSFLSQMACVCERERRKTKGKACIYKHIKGGEKTALKAELLVGSFAPMRDGRSSDRVVNGDKWLLVVRTVCTRTSPRRGETILFLCSK